VRKGTATPASGACPIGKRTAPAGGRNAPAAQREGPARERRCRVAPQRRRRRAPRHRRRDALLRSAPAAHAGSGRSARLPDPFLGQRRTQWRMDPVARDRRGAVGRGSGFDACTVGRLCERSTRGFATQRLVRSLDFFIARSRISANARSHCLKTELT
jgi:hypothetical protein